MKSFYEIADLLQRNLHTTIDFKIESHYNPAQDAIFVELVKRDNDEIEFEFKFYDVDCSRIINLDSERKLIEIIQDVLDDKTKEKNLDDLVSYYMKKGKTMRQINEILNSRKDELNDER